MDQSGPSSIDAELSSELAEAHADGFAEGKREFRERALAIMDLEEAKWCPPVAAALICNTSVTVAEAAAVLAAVPSPQRDAALAARTIN